MHSGGGLMMWACFWDPFLDLLRPPGEPSQHRGLAGLAEVLQHSPIRIHGKRANAGEPQTS